MSRINELRGWRGFMQHHELYPILEFGGFMTSGKLHPEGGRTVINGVPIRIDPAAPAIFNQRGRKVKVSTHRVFAECDCGRWVPFGRLGQHRQACHTYIGQPR